MFKFGLVLILLFLISVSAIEQSKNSDKLLTRKRRFLIFPEGSSLQLVYDQIIGMVASENLHIFGITVSLAWELPNRVHYHEDEAESSNANRKSDHFTNNSSKEQYNSYYRRGHYHDHRINITHYDYLDNKLKTKPKVQSMNGWNSASWNHESDAYNHIHRIYPVLRLRRDISRNARQNNHNWHPEVKYWLDDHRKSRIRLYKAIEKYLSARGENGEQCVLRAICETSVKMDQFDNEPASFLKEMMRSVFSFPELDSVNSITKYDVAQNINNNDCGEAFPRCPKSIWSDEFYL